MPVFEHILDKIMQEHRAQIQKPNLTIKIEEDAAGEPISSPENPTKAVLKGVLVGLGVPVFTVPLDKLQANIVIKPDTKVKVMATLVDEPFKGYGLNASTNLLRYSLIFNLAPVIENYLDKQGGDPKLGKMFAWSVAGAVEGAVMSPRAIVTQQLYTTPANICEIYSRAKVDPVLYEKFRVAALYAALRDGFYWPLFRKGVDVLERELHVKEQEATLAKSIEEFLVGCAAGWFASVISYLPDVVQKHGLHNLEKYCRTISVVKVNTIINAYRMRIDLPSLAELNDVIAVNQKAVRKPAVSFVDQYQYQWQKHGWQIIPKYCYKGYLSAAVRMVVASGATNILIHKANDVYEYLVKKNFFTASKLAPATPQVTSENKARLKI